MSSPPMSNRVSPLVVAEAVDKTYVDGPAVVRVLAGLHLVVEAGETIAIMGESGVGKSTLLHLLGALDWPSGGRILFDGHDVFRWPERELAAFRNREVGFVYQFHQLLPDFTALENTMLPALIARKPFAKARARAGALLERVGLKDRLRHRPGELSGGEQQRVAVARALMEEPRLLLADEPTGNLDPVTGGGVQQLLVELNHEHGSALVIATHNDRLAAAMGRTLRLAGGQLHEVTAQTTSRRGSAGGSAS
jgi:lipoprotein-releasing system ATP-binding protein